MLKYVSRVADERVAGSNVRAGQPLKCKTSSWSRWAGRQGTMSWHEYSKVKSLNWSNVRLGQRERAWESTTSRFEPRFRLRRVKMGRSIHLRPSWIDLGNSTLQGSAR